MREGLSKILISIIGLLIIANPILQIANPKVARAENQEDGAIATSDDPDSPDWNQPMIDIKDQGNFKYNIQLNQSDDAKRARLKLSDAYNKIIEVMGQFSSIKSTITFADLFNTKREARLVLPRKDFENIKSMLCLLDILPDYDRDFTALYKDLPSKEKSAVNKVISDEKSKPQPFFTNPTQYFNYLKLGREGEEDRIRFENRTLYRSYITAAKLSQSNAKLRNIWATESQNIARGKDTTVGLNTLSCVTRMDREDLVNSMQSEEGRLDVYSRLTSALDASKIDIRTLKTMIYLITPKDQGGAGHWRVKVQKLLQYQEKSTESDVTLTGQSGGVTSAPSCEEGMTAAECGQANAPVADATVTDKDGTQYNAYLEQMEKEEDTFLSQVNGQKQDLNSQRNISAHFKGQAVDISEIDDIRCTKIKVPNSFLGGKTKYEKQAARPIKLAWQASESLAGSSSADDFDMMSLLRSLSADGLRSFLDETGMDIGDYEGDLTKANFDDIIGLIGKSVLGYILNAPGFSPKDYNLNASFRTLGGMYMADYLGLPRTIFEGQDVDSLEKLNYVIGRAAIEKRMGLPLNSLDGENTLPGTKLQKVLRGIGVRKIEYEASLNHGDMEDFFSSTKDPEEGLVDSADFETVIGRRVIEKELNIVKDSWPKTNVLFSDLSETISDLRLNMIKIDPLAIDSFLHIDSGVTESFIKGNIKSSDYAKAVGTKRAKDTLFGLKYFAVNNTAYQLPSPTKEHPEVPNTWEQVLQGEIGAAETIGIYTLAKVLGEDNYDIGMPKNANLTRIVVTENGYEQEIQQSEFGKFMFREWLRQNLNRDDCQAPNIGQSISYSAGSNGSTLVKGTFGAIRNSLSPTMSLNYDVYYKTDISTVERKIERRNWAAKLPEEKAKGFGLESYDIVRILGCAKTNGRTVFERIGSKLLYIGIANKLLTKEERVRIDLNDTNPQLRVDNEEIGFYLTRAIRAKELVQEIEDDYRDLGLEGAQAQRILDRINKIKETLNNLFADADPDNLKGRKIIESAATIITELDALEEDLNNLRDQKQISANGVNEEVAKLNNLITKVNELVRVLSEIIAGKPINSADRLQIKQINGITLDGSTPSTGSGNAGDGGSSGGGGACTSSDNAREISTLKTAKIIFLTLARKINPMDMFLRIGAGMAESSLGLPKNSLLYLVENYDMRGLKASDALIQAIGQARIEEYFCMDEFYFQGFNFAKKPNFGDNRELQKWLPNTHPWRALQEGVFDNIANNLKEKNLVEYKLLISKAEQNWRKYLEGEVKKYGQVSLGEKNLDDVVKHLKEEKGISNPEDDLLEKLGLPVGQYNALKTGSVTAWQAASARVAAIDRAFAIKQGTTKKMITGEDLHTASLSNDEKNAMVIDLALSKNALEKYIQLLNREILPTDVGLYNQNGLKPDYTGINPYADNSKACPIGFNLDNGFYINNTTIENNSYLYIDYSGHHTFASSEEAETYAAEHPENRITSVITALAISLASLIELDKDPKKNVEAIEKKITAFVNNTSTTSVFTDGEWEIIAKTAQGQKLADSLKKILKRDAIPLPVPYFKKRVGSVEAKKILNRELFNSLGIEIDPTLFTPDDFYTVLTGDLRPLFRVGTYILDRSMGLKDGTTLMIYAARKKEARDCALSNAAGALFGSVFGLNYIDFKGNLIENIGEAKVEETLGLARGSFKGEKISDVAKRAGVINFLIAFKFPLNEGVLDPYLKDILGKEKADSVKNLPPNEQLKEIQEFVRTNRYLIREASKAITSLDKLLNDNWLPNFLNTLKVAPGQIPTKISDFRTNSQKEIDRYYAIQNFFDWIVALDNTFSLPHFATYEVLAGLITPTEFNKRIGEKLAVRTGISELGQLLGVSEERAETVATLVTNFRNVFVCNSTSAVSAGVREGISGNSQPTIDGCYDTTYYHNWGWLYDNLDELFKFKVDERMSWPSGTTAEIINNPSNAFPVMLKIGTQKADEYFKLDSNSNLSFTGLYEAYHGDYEESGPNSDIERCHNLAYPGGLDHALAMQMESAQKRNDSDAIKRTQIEIKSRNDIEQRCRIEARKAEADLEKEYTKENGVVVPTDWKGRLVEWVYSVIAEKMHVYLINVEVTINGTKTNVGIDMPEEDILLAVRSGDMRYWLTAVTAISVNVAMIPIDNIGIENCNEEVSGECRTAVPTEMRIDYDDIKLAYIGMPNSQAIQIAALQEITDDQDPSSFRDALDEGEGDGTATFSNDLADSANYTAPDIQTQVNSQYGYNDQSLESAKEGLSSEERDVLDNPSRYYDPNYDGKSNPNLTPERQKRVDDIQAHARKVAMQNLQFKLLDMALWKLDASIPPGFARTLFQGSPQEKVAIIIKYLNNGLSSGRLFGIKFDALPGDWLKVAAFVYDYFHANTVEKKQTAFDSFIANDGLNFLSGFIEKNSKKWLHGIEIPGDVAKALLLGIFTGEWGLQSFTLTDAPGATGHEKVTRGGQEIPTLGGVVVNWAVNKVMSGVDHALGLEAGTSLQVYKASVNLYKAWKAYKGAKTAENAAKFKEAGIVLARMVTDIIVHKLVGKEIAGIEEDLGMIPGTLEQLVSTLAYQYVVAPALHAVFGVNWFLGPWGIIASVLIAALGWLAGAQYYYQCNADGYYSTSKPNDINDGDIQRSGTPNYDQNDVSDIGEWGGKLTSKRAEALQKTMQQKYIAAAQYKAKRLIGDMLMLPTEAKYNDASGEPVMPIQIMTGRKEDVEYWNALITSNMCQARFGPSVIACGGICGEKSADGTCTTTLMGIWSNPQTTAWTHIGF